MAEQRRVAIVYRGDPQARDAVGFARLGPITQALSEAGIAAEPTVYADEIADEVRAQLIGIDGTLVWVDPIANGEDRTVLDALLREVAERGTWVSAHPDAVMKIGTKEVLYTTRELGWGGDIHLYRTLQEFEEDFPRRLALAGPRVLKQLRGNGGIGVWKVALDDDAAVLPRAPLEDAKRPDARVRVQHAQIRDTTSEELSLGAFMQRCAAYFQTGTAGLIDQAFQPRITEGMIRCYLVKDEVVGFARQYPTGLAPLHGEGAGSLGCAKVPSPELVFGLPAEKTMYGAGEPALQTLRRLLEADWIPGLQSLAGIHTVELPALWDADFLFGPKTDTGEDTYVLCEINASSVIPFPDQVPRTLAEAVSAALEAHSNRG